MAYPTSSYRYTKEHEWIAAKGDTATIGITDYAQHELGRRGVCGAARGRRKAVTAGKTFGSVESVKAVSEIYAPVSGEVIEANAELAQQTRDRSIRIRTAPAG